MARKIPLSKRILRRIIIFLVFLFFDVRFEGERHLGEKFVIAPNHFHMLDPLFLAAVFPDDVTGIGKEELMKNWLLRKILETLEVVPVNREKMSLSTIRQSLDRLKHMSLIIFPEGTRNKDTSKPLKAKPGLAMIAHKANARILPVAITNYAKPFRRVKIIFLEPISVEECGFERLNSESYQIIGDNIMKQIFERIQLENQNC